jgi:transposase-like protein
MSNSYQPKPRYSEALKIQICELIISGEMNIEEARNHFNIGGSVTIQRWLLKFGYTEASQAMSKSPEKEDPEVLKARIKALEEQLKHERLRTELLDTIIDRAEDQMKIKIRKKSSTRQSDK